jgi:2-polyprenyl-3-methyl-5-hydroxy-6-metoxy-1,4-benzoquinol methylase
VAALDLNDGGMHEHEHEENVFTQEYWDARYSASQRVWSGNANLRLVELAADLAPGTALDVGCGEGGDALWLADRGWQVTGADVSTVALERAERHAAEAGLAEWTSWLHVDLVAGDPLPGGADLVTAMFVHVPDAVFDRVYRAVAEAVRPGGVLLVAGHHPAEADTNLRNPHLGHLLFPPERVTRLLTEGWRVEVAEPRTREQVKDGETLVATDTVVFARREPAS